VVQVLDMGRDPRDGTLYIVEEFLTGRDLKQVLAEQRVLSPRAALQIMVPVMAGLAMVHRHGIVHRDIKPGNIFLARGADGQVTPKLIDFGVSKVATPDRDPSGLTQAGATVGTPAYMSPEQATGGRAVDAQTDVWAVGVVLVEMLTGRCPFDDENYFTLLARIVHGPTPSIEDLGASVPPALEEVIYRALERDRAVRYRDMGQFLDAVLDCSALREEPWHQALVRQYRPGAGGMGMDTVFRMVAPAPDNEPTISLPTRPTQSLPPPPGPLGGEFESDVGQAAIESATTDPDAPAAAPALASAPLVPPPSPALAMPPAPAVLPAPPRAPARPRLPVLVAIFVLIGCASAASAAWLARVRHAARASHPSPRAPLPPTAPLPATAPASFAPTPAVASTSTPSLPSPLAAPASRAAPATSTSAPSPRPRTGPRPRTSRSTTTPAFPPPRARAADPPVLRVWR
jgi:hypothetical protein